MQSPSKRQVTQRVQRWLAKHEYLCGYGFKLHRCARRGAPVAICRRGVVDAYGGGCVVTPWSKYTPRAILRLLRAAQREAKILETRSD